MDHTTFVTRIEGTVTPLEVYTHWHQKMLCCCAKCGNTWTATTTNLMIAKSACPICAREVIESKKTLNRVENIKKTTTTRQNKYSSRLKHYWRAKCPDYIIEDYRSDSDPVTIVCPTHGRLILQNANTVQPKRSERENKMTPCTTCNRSNLKRYTTTTYVDAARLKHSNKYNYDQTIYTSIIDKVYICCPRHGGFWQKAAAHLQGTGCGKCKESKGEAKIRLFLEEANIKHQVQCKLGGRSERGGLMIYDFFLPDFNLIIEYDGIQHYKPTTWSRKSISPQENLKQIQSRDNLKTLWVVDNGFQILRIKYTDIDNVCTIISNRLSELSKTHR